MPAPDPLMVVEELKLWILRKLGAPIVVVELADCHLEDAVEEAKRWMAAKKGVIRMSSLTTIPGQTEYQIESDADLVTEVAFTSAPMDLSLGGTAFYLPEQYGQFPSRGMSSPSSGGLYSSITQTMQMVEMGRRILSLEKDWSWHETTRSLFIYPTPQQAEKVIYFFKSRQFQIDQLSERDHQLLKRYALAKAKEVLGEIRGKIDSFPTAQGSTSLNGQALKQEAAEELQRLDEELMKSGSPLPIIAG